MCSWFRTLTVCLPEFCLSRTSNLGKIPIIPIIFGRKFTPLKYPKYPYFGYTKIFGSIINVFFGRTQTRTHGFDRNHDQPWLLCRLLNELRCLKTPLIVRCIIYVIEKSTDITLYAYFCTHLVSNCLLSLHDIVDALSAIASHYSLLVPCAHCCISYIHTV